MQFLHAQDTSQVILSEPVKTIVIHPENRVGEISPSVLGIKYAKQKQRQGALIIGLGIALSGSQYFYLKELRKQMDTNSDIFTYYFYQYIQLTSVALIIEGMAISAFGIVKIRKTNKKIKTINEFYSAK